MSKNQFMNWKKPNPQLSAEQINLVQCLQAHFHPAELANVFLYLEAAPENFDGLEKLNRLILASFGDIYTAIDVAAAQGVPAEGSEAAPISLAKPDAPVVGELRIRYGTTVVLAKRVGPAIHLLDLEAEGRGMTLTNAINPAFQDYVLKRLGLDDEAPAHFVWVLYHTDGFVTRYGAGDSGRVGFQPIGNHPVDETFRAEMQRLYGVGGVH